MSNPSEQRKAEDLLDDHESAVEDVRFKLSYMARDTDYLPHLNKRAPYARIVNLIDIVGELTDEVNELEMELKDLAFATNQTEEKMVGGD